MTTGTSLGRWLKSMVSWEKLSSALNRRTTGTLTTDRWPSTTNSSDIKVDLSLVSKAVSRREDAVFGLTKTQLISEVFSLRQDLLLATEKVVHLEEDRDEAYTRLYEFERRQEERLDILLGKQSEIIDQRLGLTQTGTRPDTSGIRPVGKNRGWQAQYEQRQREAKAVKLANPTPEVKANAQHWDKVVAEAEAADPILDDVTNV